jgi:hypothetical protein
MMQYCNNSDIFDMKQPQNPLIHRNCIHKPFASRAKSPMQQSEFQRFNHEPAFHRGSIHMRKIRILALASVGVVSLSMPAFAQTAKKG